MPAVAGTIAAILCVATAGRAEAPPAPRTLRQFGQLETELRHVRRPTCWNLVLRGRLSNPYDEPVDGIRLIVRLLSGGDEPREFERIVTDLRRKIPAQGSVPFNRELTTACTSVFSTMSVVAFADHLGDERLPAPSLETEIEAAQVEEAFHMGGNVSPMPNVGGWNPSFR